MPRGFVLPESCSLSERCKIKDIEYDNGLARELRNSSFADARYSQ